MFERVPAGQIAVCVLNKWFGAACSPSASGGYVYIDMPRCLQGTPVAWNFATFKRTGTRTAARKYWRARCHCKRRRTDASKVLAATTNDDDWKQEDGEQGAGRSVWGGTH